MARRRPTELEESDVGRARPGDALGCGPQRADDHSGAIGTLKTGDGICACVGVIPAEHLRRIGEALEQPPPDLHMVREHHERLLAGSRESRRRLDELALRGETAQVVQARELLGAQRIGDPGLERSQIKQKRVQLRDQVPLSASIEAPMGQ